MPHRSRVEALVRAVEGGRFIEALETFYAPDAVTRENIGEQICGLPQLIKKEQYVLHMHRSIATRPGTTYLLDGERVVINWVFDFERHDGSRTALDELAYQWWRDEHIIQEQFYYDPAQREVRAATDVALA